MRGRKPKPSALKEAEGNRGKKKRRIPIAGVHPVDSQSPVPPVWLDQSARVLWRAFLPELRKLNLVRRIDQLALGCLFDSAATLRMAKRKVMKLRAQLRREKKDPDEALLITTPNGSFQISPLLSIINREKLNIQRFSAEFGMTASARARLMMEEGGPKDEEAWEELLDKPRDDSDIDDADLTIQ